MDQAARANGRAGVASIIGVTSLATFLANLSSTATYLAAPEITVGRAVAIGGLGALFVPGDPSSYTTIFWVSAALTGLGAALVVGLHRDTRAAALAAPTNLLTLALAVAMKHSLVRRHLQIVVL
jgi:hypothetical protein